MSKKLYIKTYGCQMNEYDSARMADVLQPMGYEKTETPEGADLVILNTCHIREKASEKVYSELGRIRAEKEQRRAEGDQMLIGVAGCVAQAEGEEIMKRARFVDLVVGPQSYHRLPEMVTRAVRDGGGVVELDFPEEPKFDFLPESTSHRGASAFLSVQEGCDKFCTFCVVPYTRGAEYSRAADAVLAEAKNLVRQGVVEITLLGQNVNAYHGAGPDGKDWNLARLIQELGKIQGLARIRYTTSHPRDMDEDLIAAHGYEAKLMPYLHLPVQSGSDRILKAMNRRHTAEDYLAIIEKLRRARPDLALSSDFIVGFPGETDQDFEDTMTLVSAVEYAQAFSFKYSPRPGTPASVLETQLDESVKSERLSHLQSLLNQQQEAFNRSTVDMTVPVLLEKQGKYEDQLVGKSPYLQSVHVNDCRVPTGRIAQVRITEAFANSVAGTLSKTSGAGEPFQEAMAS